MIRSGLDEKDQRRPTCRVGDDGDLRARSRGGRVARTAAPAHTAPIAQRVQATSRRADGDGRRDACAPRARAGHGRSAQAWIMGPGSDGCRS